MFSRSPDRYSFGKELDAAGNLTKESAQIVEESQRRVLAAENTPEWQKDNMEYDLRSTQWILDKVRGNDNYAQNLYAAMCNNDFIKNEVWNILQEKQWSCSWRHAGGIVADMREKGDYIDWYCSGSRPRQPASMPSTIAGLYVDEEVVTDEIRIDLLKLGWQVVST